MQNYFADLKDIFHNKLKKIEKNNFHLMFSENIIMNKHLDNFTWINLLFFKKIFSVFVEKRISFCVDYNFSFTVLYVFYADIYKIFKISSKYIHTEYFCITL